MFHHDGVFLFLPLDETLTIISYDKFQYLGNAVPPLFCGELACVHRKVVKDQSGLALRL